MSEASKMICPDCGAVMNHHAMKVDHGDYDARDSIYGGDLNEVHTCPECGRVDLRQADEAIEGTGYRVQGTG